MEMKASVSLNAKRNTKHTSTHFSTPRQRWRTRRQQHLAAHRTRALGGLSLSLSLSLSLFLSLYGRYSSPLRSSSFFGAPLSRVDASRAAMPNAARVKACA